MQHMVGGEHSLKMLALTLLRFGIDSVLKILNKRITQSVNDKGVYRPAPATPGLLKNMYFSSDRLVKNILTPRFL